MGKYIDIITAIGALLTKILPTRCKSKCCSGSECECGEKNLIDEELENPVENATVSSV
tara:strand:+ start:208 stop:381 length:174 start_codon:yes stop_codon:yes gene_type:complete